VEHEICIKNIVKDKVYRTSSTRMVSTAGAPTLKDKGTVAWDVQEGKIEGLKGQCHEIFAYGFFMNQFPPSP
jgi:hypothetical protein